MIAHGPGRPAYRWDVAFWTAACAALVLLRGVQWDETYEHARTLIGAVRYPEGHPLPAYLYRAFSVQLYASAALTWLTKSALLVNGLRNLLCLMATAVPVYLLARDGSGRRGYGIAAAALVLAGALGPFRGAYFPVTWPGIFSNGHIGFGAAALALWALCTGRMGLAGCLAAAMPAIHIGQAPPIVATAAAAFAAAAAYDRPAMRRMAAGLAWGAAITAATAVTAFVVGRWAPPIADTEGWRSIWQCFTFVHDTHRRHLPDSARIAALHAAVLCGLLAWRGGRTLRSMAVWCGVYTAVVTVIVFVTWAIHRRMGMELPYWAIGWMPYRLINHLPYLTLALALAAIARLPGGRGGWLTAALLCAALAAVPFAGRIWPGLEPYFRDPGFAVYVAAGLAAGALGARRDMRLGRAAIVFAAAGAALLALPAFWGFHAGAAWTGLGLTVGVAAARWPVSTRERRMADWAGRALAAAALALLVFESAAEIRHGTGHLPRTEAERAFGAYLAVHARPGDVVAAPPYMNSLQEKIGRPVIEETSTAALMSYIPALAPSIQRIYYAVYGIDYRLSAAAAPQGDWRPVWVARSPEGWAELRRTFGIAYVMAPSDAPLQLEPVAAAGAMTLYETP